MAYLTAISAVMMFFASIVTASRVSVFVKISKALELNDDQFAFDCIRQCAASSHCAGVNVLSLEQKSENFDIIQVRNLTGFDGQFYKKIFPGCKNGGHWGDDMCTYCTCPESFTGAFCERYWNDCTEGFKLGWNVSGVYTIQPWTSPVPFQVYCEMRFKGRTYIQRQKDGTDFYKNWQEYRDGFGNLVKDHWLGLEKIKAIANSNELTLTINLKYSTCCPIWRQGLFHAFNLTNEVDGYRMTFSHMTTEPEHSLSDALTELKGARFSTYDRDNDDNPKGNCAQTHRSGWWFKNCTRCNPNGRLKPIPNILSGDPVELFWTGDTRDIEQMFMILRRL